MKNEVLQYRSDKITLGSDGKYRWVYEMNLLKNPTVFLLIWKIFFFIILGIFAFVFIADTLNGYMDGERAAFNLKVFAYFLVGMTAVTALGYLIYAAIMGGKYIVEFEMDEKGVNHRQIAAQAEKTKKIGAMTAAAGLKTGSFSTAAAGINAQRTEMYSEFEKTRNVKAYPRRGLIKVNGLLDHNQVYAAKEDFEFVKDYIVSHCPNLKK